MRQITEGGRSDQRPMAPIYVRIFKEESVFEIPEAPGRLAGYALLSTYEICAWSGELGWKMAEGDRRRSKVFTRVTI